jgi:hypothetical protein
MLGSAILETAIGAAFVFLLLSLIASAAREAIEVWMRSRAGHLEAGIRGLLDQGGVIGLAKDFYQHPLVASLYDPAKPKDRPSYIPARNFALALLDMAARGRGLKEEKAAVATSTPISLDAVRQGVQAIQNVSVQRAILTAVDSAEGNLAAAQLNLQEWYDSAMDRVSGAYKRQTQKLLLLLGFGLAAAANVDAIAVVRHLYRDDAVRKVVVQQATSFVQSADSAPSIAALQERIDSLPLPLGWSRSRPVGLEWLTTLLGWGVTALAVSLGAPFWFDLLNKFMVIRSTVKPKEKSPEEGSEDRRPAQTKQPVGGK